MRRALLTGWYFDPSARAPAMALAYLNLALWSLLLLVVQAGR